MSSKSGNLVPWPFLFVWGADEIGKGLRTRFIFKRVKSGGREGEGGSRFDHDGLLLRAY